MIITCPDCNKQFKIDNSLIPDEGRNLQCGSCDHVWFYKIEEENNELLKLNEEIDSKNIEIQAEKIDRKKQVKKEIKINKNNEKKVKNLETQINPSLSINTPNIGSKFFSYLIVFIISFVALIIFLDTLKTPLIDVFPALEIILFNLFETLQDLKLFIIDLL